MVNVLIHGANGRMGREVCRMISETEGMTVAATVDKMGGEGMRIIYSFKEPVDPSRQAEIKLRTNEIESMLAENGGRRVNLDPGFISHGRLMLATTKKAGFRIPLKDGIYTEMTLFYAKGEWQKLPWTYRDYQSKKVQSFLIKARNSYLEWRKSTDK